MAAWRQILQRGRGEELVRRKSSRGLAVWQDNGGFRSAGALRMGMDGCGSRWYWSLLDDGRAAGYEDSVTAENVSNLCRRGKLREAVEALGILVQTCGSSSKYLLYALLKKCVGDNNLVLGRRVHAFTVKAGYQSDTFLCNHILRMYVAHGRLQDAVDVFAVVSRPDAYTWSAIISAHVKEGEDKQAIGLYRVMRRSSVRPDGHVFVAALQACARGADLGAVQELHADVLADGVEHDLYVWNCLVDAYAKCGNLREARRVFDGLGTKDVVTWNAMIAGYSQQGMGHEALCLHDAMLEHGMVTPDCVTFVSLLQACAGIGATALDEGRKLHAEIRDRGHQTDVFVGNSLVNMYAKCGSLGDGRKVFDGLRKKDVVTWNGMIAGYSQQGMGQDAILLYHEMQERSMATPDRVTFLCLLQACASVGTPALEMGKNIHAQVRQHGHHTDLFVANSLVNMYAKCGSLQCAQVVFDEIGRKDVVSWNAMIAGFSQHGMDQEAMRLYSAMREEGITAPTSMTFMSLLQTCARLGTPGLEIGKHIHAHVREQGLQDDVFVASSLVNMYSKCGSLEDARRVFDGLDQTDLVLCTSLIAAYSQQGMGYEALSLYSAVQEHHITAPDSVTFVCLLQACARLGAPALEKGMQLHAEIKQKEHQIDVFVASSLINMYVKCGSLEDARSVFEGLALKDVATWNAMISGYSQQGLGQEALLLYRAMQERSNALPDCVTFVSLLQACASVGNPALETGKQFHAQIREQGHQGDVFVDSSLVNMYAKCGSLEDAERIFNTLQQKDVVTWTSMIGGYAQQGMGKEALRLYSVMQEEGIAVVDCVTFVCLLQACANVAALHVGRQIHAQIEEQGLQADVSIAGSLINMYGKSGSMVDAQQVFDEVPIRDVVAWTALIAGYTCQGDSEAVFRLVTRMTQEGTKPLGITFLSVLTVCSHSGLVNKGREYFEAMSSNYGITPTVEHYTCMVDLLGRAGQVDEALGLVRTMPLLPNASVWHTLLAACQKWSNVDVGRQAFEEALKMDMIDAASYVLLSNIYSGAQMWEQAQELQARRVRIKAWKQPGQSWWTDMDGLVHSFYVGGSNM